MERLSVEDAKLATRADILIERVQEAYPDGNVADLAKDHKSLSNKLGELAKKIGYDNKNEMLEAYGFTIVHKSDGSSTSGGRPVNDHEALFAELRKRYSIKPKPKTTTQLTKENPDLAGQLKTLTNKSVQFFGKKFKQVLIEQGILSSKNDSAELRGKVESMLENLADIYAEPASRLKTIDELHAAHPEFAEEFKAYAGNCAQWYGSTPKKVLVHRNILANPTLISEEEIKTLIEELKEEYEPLPREKKPKSIGELCEIEETHAQKIQLAQKACRDRGKKLRVILQDEGILALSNKVHDERRAESNKRAIRNATPTELAAFWLASGMPSMITRSGDVKLPSYVLNVDIEKGIETQKSILIRRMISSNAETFAKNMSNTEVVSISGQKGSPFVFVQMERLQTTPLTSKTMLNIIYNNQLIEDADLLGGDRWREVLDKDSLQ